MVEDGFQRACYEEPQDWWMALFGMAPCQALMSLYTVNRWPTSPECVSVFTLSFWLSPSSLSSLLHLFCRHSLHLYTLKTFSQQDRAKTANTSSSIKTLESLFEKPPVKPSAVCSVGVGERNHVSADVALDGGVHVAFCRVLSGRGNIFEPPYVQPLPCVQSPCQHGQSASSRGTCGERSSGPSPGQLQSHLLWDHVWCWQHRHPYPHLQVHSKRPR